MKKIGLLFFVAFIILSMDNTQVSKNELLGKFNPTKHTDFVVIEKTYTNKSGIYLRKETYEAFKRMNEDARSNNIHLEIKSATRNFDYQKGIWERKFARPKYKGWSELAIVKDILKYSSMPGTSRHHWGTDIDFNSFENAYFEKGEGKRIYDWLLDCGPEYGFHQVYITKKDGRKGYEEEKWHWTYLPLSKDYLKEYLQRVSYSDISGFKGAIYAKEVQAINHYVGGVNPDILE